MPHFVYILQSEVDTSYYIGSTANVLKRLHEHNAGLSRYTMHRVARSFRTARCIALF